MPKRYWIITALPGLIVFCGALWYSWDRFSTYQQNQANERAAAAHYQADTAQHSPDSCRAVMGESGLFDWLTCLANNISADGGVKQAEYDLKAQQDMSAWALGMLIATVWLTVITLFGVYFVWRTLLATQDMARETREIGEAQTRAYLSIESATVIDEKGYFTKIRIVIKNTGMTPARNVLIKAKIVPFSIMNETEFIEGPSLSYDLGSGGFYQFEHHIGTPRSMFDFAEWRDSNDKMSASIYVEFKDVFESCWLVKFSFSSTAREFVNNRQLLVLKSEEKQKH